MPTFRNIVGQRFGQLTVTAQSAHIRGKVTWNCACDCGSITTVQSCNLTSGNTASCGCLRRLPPPNKTHGMKGTSTYNVWCNMRRRCGDPKNRSFPEYGGRGIHVCARWQDFAVFLADMGERPPGLSLDRIDNDGQYETGNCRWATKAQQANNKRSNRRIEHVGECLTLQQWSARTGIPPTRIQQRIDIEGWSIADALGTPTRKGKYGQHATSK